MNKKDNDILARDLVLAAFIVMKRQYESRDAGRAGKLQMFLNIHAGTHGDVKNIVAILNNPKSTAKLSDDQQRIYQRALDIVESVSEVAPGWSAQIDISNLTPEKIEVLQAIWTNTEPSESVTIEPEQPKPKPGRKAKNPIETATTNAKKKGKACCN